VSSAGLNAAYPHQNSYWIVRISLVGHCAPKQVISKVLETGTDSRDVAVWNTKNSFLQPNIPTSMTYLKENHQNGRVSTSEILAASYIDEPNRTYAAVAARASEGLAGVRRETRSKKRRIEQLMNTSLHLVFLITSRIHRGHINMKMPRPSRTISAKMSTRLSL
jgi:hypothetical protein